MESSVFKSVFIVLRKGVQKRGRKSKKRRTFSKFSRRFFEKRRSRGHRTKRIIEDMREPPITIEKWKGYSEITESAPQNEMIHGVTFGLHLGVKWWACCCKDDTCRHVCVTWGGTMVRWWEKRARERLKRGLLGMFENGVAAWLLHLLYIDEIASVYRRS